MTKSDIRHNLGKLIQDIEDRDDLPLRDLALLWQVYDLLEPGREEREYCDDCGCEVTKETRCAVSCLPRGVESANAGESATLCRDCLHELGERIDREQPDCDPETGIPYGELT